MLNYTLRNHIPIAGTGNREPCTGNESPFRVCLGFTPKWYRDRLGIDFSGRWHIDPLYRYDTVAEMKKYLTALFPSIQNFRPKNEGGIDYDCAAINSIYGAVIISALYGQKTHYSKDNWPLTEADNYFSKEEILEIPPFDPETNPAFRELSLQLDFIENHWGRICGYLNYYQGILNTAFRLRGQDIFMDLAEDPDFIKYFFDHIFNTTITFIKLIQERQRKSGFPIDQHSSANCVVNMISAGMYEEFVLPYDMKFAEAFPRYGIHTCNWDATPYFNAMRKIKKMGYLDMGMNSDMRQAKKLFPDARRGVLYGPVKIKNYTLEDIKKDFVKIRDELGPCDIILADIESDVPNEKMQKIVSIAEMIAEKGK